MEPSAQDPPEGTTPPRTRTTERAVSVPRQRGAGCRRVAVAGDVDITTAPELGRLLHRHLDDLTEGEVLVVDLSRIGHFSAAGLHVLRQAAATAREHDVTFRVVRASRQVDRVLGLCGVTFTGPDGS